MPYSGGEGHYELLSFIGKKVLVSGRVIVGDFDAPMFKVIVDDINFEADNNASFTDPVFDYLCNAEIGSTIAWPKVFTHFIKSRLIRFSLHPNFLSLLFTTLPKETTTILKNNNKNKKNKQKAYSSYGGSNKLGESRKERNNNINYGDALSLRLGNFNKYVEGEQVAAGWPQWLSVMAGEAIQGWVPLRVDSFEKLEKIGQGTYNNVFRVQELKTGKIVALKKVRFYNFEPESVRLSAICNSYYLDLSTAIRGGTGRQQLTSRVVKWYRPPELLLGLTDYGEAVDLWSIGCVFAELFLGKPLLQGRTEVEQLNKIFKLCGSPLEEYWKKSKLPHTFYQSNLINVGGPAASGLAFEYFTTKPYACDPSTLAKYAPNKEIDAKICEKAGRKKAGGKVRGSDAARRPSKAFKTSREQNGFGKSVALEEKLQTNSQHIRKINGGNVHVLDENNDSRLSEKPPKLLVDAVQETSHSRNASQGNIPFSGPLHVMASSGFSWAKKCKEDIESVRFPSRSSSRGHVSTALDPPSVRYLRNSSEIKCQENGELLGETRTESQDNDSHEIVKHATRRQWNQCECPDSFDASNVYHSQQLSSTKYQKEEMTAKRCNMGYDDDEQRVDFSGPILS
ncbi:hypothetical protein GIB67_015076 [Kingdonia uniflora]|uniref:Protein kinase domain-containing protein n=1 Tax=Kingdonia uniflora TaxID=39325 RepID=A0A7J7NMV8_9MAGN|nr:hypothetical protein GIB67_015076 [Kingdonia uniflora]